MMKDRYQICIITDSEGKIHSFTGKAAFEVGASIHITSIKFTEPKELPEGYEIGPLFEAQEEEE